MKYIKIIFCLFLIVISFYFTINSSFYEGDLVDINNMNTKKIIKNIFLSIGNEKTNNVLNLLKSNNSNEIVINTIDTNSTNKKIEVYLYNSHNREEYKTNIYGITPSVMDVSNMIQNELLKYYVYSYVEKMDVVGEIKKRDLEYYDTYDISRNNIISIRKKYPSINYIFDIHRDSVSGDLSRVKINDKSYAKIMFLVGKKNSNYKENEKNIKVMSDYINKKYPGILRNYYYSQYFLYAAFMFFFFKVLFIPFSATCSNIYVINSFVFSFIFIFSLSLFQYSNSYSFVQFFPS